MTPPRPGHRPSHSDVSNSKGTVTVFGAYGHTAGFVASELTLRGWDLILSGRDADKLQAAADRHPGSGSRVASIEDLDSVDRALAGAAAVINCAGPFGESTPALIDAALRAGIPYIDFTAEPFVTIETFENYTDPARDAGIVVLPSMGFFGALGDLLATAAMGDWPSADEITVAVALDSWTPTRGTRLAGERRAGRRLVWTDDHMTERSDQEPRPIGKWDFPAPFGTQQVEGEFSTVDTLTIAHHLSVPQISTYFYLDATGDPDRSIEAPVGRSAQVFVIEAAARRDGQERRVTARGRDIYAVTAPLVVEALERILDGRCFVTGVVSAGEAFDTQDFLGALHEDPENGFSLDR
ncbi:short subunit dehydrogenase-like uncharacterized protein [Nakamurella sp. UYEF19]|uniref:saccharopine dehydrogenase family protein n=1 Tax=Nakamurella sp. UYEF19 TaxID=1756392 RepID=UPI00339A4280